MTFQFSNSTSVFVLFFFMCLCDVFIRGSTVLTCQHVANSITEVIYSSGCVMLPQEKICCCPLFVTQFVSKICWCFSTHPSQLMSDSPRRVQWLSAQLSLEVTELNFPQISLLRLLSVLFCCRERLSDYHSVKKNVGEKVESFRSIRFFLLPPGNLQLCVAFVLL